MTKMMKGLTFSACLAMGAAVLNSIGVAAEAQESPPGSGESVRRVASEKATIEIKGTFVGADEKENEAPVFYTTRGDTRIHFGESRSQVTTTMEVTVFQGTLKEWVLRIEGKGEVIAVEGVAWQDWSVRKAADGSRSLVIRPKDPGAGLKSVSGKSAGDGEDPASRIVTSAAVIRAEHAYDSLPAEWEPPRFIPSGAASHQGTLRLGGEPSVAFEVTRSDGLTRLVTEAMPEARQAAGDPNAPRPMAYSMEAPEYVLTIALKPGDPDANRIQFSEFRLHGNVTNRVANFRLTGQVRVRPERGGVLRVLGGAAALTDIDDGADGYTIRYGDRGYVLVFDRAGVYPVNLEFDARVDSAGGWNGISFDVANASLRPVTLSGLPEETQFNAGSASRPERAGADFKTYLPSHGGLRLRWKAREPEAEGRLFYAVEAVAQASVGPGLMRQTHVLDYKVMQGDLKALRLTLRGSGEVVRVEGADILGWEVESDPAENGAADGNRTLIVMLNHAQTSEYNIVIHTQTPLGSFPADTEPLRLIPGDAIRFGGHMRVINNGAVRLEVTESGGLSQISPDRFPQSAALSQEASRATQVFAFRFSGAEYVLRIQADNVLPELSVSELLVYYLGETEVRIEAELELEIREAPLRELVIQVPAGFAVAQLGVPQLSDYFLAPTAQTNIAELKLSFSQPLSGRQVLQFKLEQNQNLTEASWPVPKIDVSRAKSVRGSVGFIAEPGLRLNAERVEGLTEVAAAFFPKKIDGLQMTYRIRERNWSAQLGLERLSLSLQVDALHLFSVGEGIVYGSSIVNYIVSGAPVSTLRFSVPSEYGNIEFIGRDVRNWRKLEDDVFEVALHSPVFGAYTVLATFDHQFRAQGETLAFSGVRPLDVQSDRGNVIVTSEFQFQVQTDSVSDGLITLDPAEIPAEHRLLFSAPILSAHQYTARPFDLRLALTPFAQGDTVSQVVDRALFETKVSSRGQILTFARYFVKNRGHAHFRFALPPDTELWEAAVSGAQAVPVDDAGQTLVPIPRNIEDGDVVEVTLRLARTTGGDGGGQSDLRIGLPAVTAPVLLAEWNIEPDPGYRLDFKSGSLAPVGRALDRSGFAWIQRLLNGRFGSDRSLMILSAAAAMLAGLGVFRWATRPDRTRWSLQNIAGLIVALIACGYAFSVFLGMAGFAGNQSLDPGRSLAFRIPVQESAAALAVRVQNVEIAEAGLSILKLWPAVFTLVLWIAARRAPDAWRRHGLLLGGWVVLAWAMLRLEGGAAGFLVLLCVFVLVHGLIPLIQRQRSVQVRRNPDPDPDPDPKPEPGSKPDPDSDPPSSAVPAGTGLIAGLLALSFGSPSTAAADFSPDDLRDRVAVREVIQTGRVNRDAVEVEASLSWDAVKGQTLPFLGAPAVLTSITLPDGEALRLSEGPDPDRIEYLLHADTSGLYSVTFSYELKVDTDGLIRRFTVPTHPAWINRFDLTVDRAGIEFIAPEAVSIRTQSIGSGTDAENGAEGTRALFTLEPVGGASISWQPRGRDTSVEEAVLYAELNQLFIPGAGIVEGIHDIRVRPAQGQLEELSVIIPPEMTVTDVLAPIVSTWRFDPDTRRLRIQFSNPQAAAFDLRVASQKTAAPLPYDATMQMIRVHQAAGQIGLAGIATGQEVQLDQAEVAEMTAINLEDFPGASVASHAGSVPGLTLRRAFRYADTDAALTFQVAAVEPDVRVATRQTLSLGEDRTVLGVDLLVSIHRAGVFRLSFPLPDRLEVESISGPALSHWTQLDGPVGGGDTNPTVTLHLKGKTEGQQRFALAFVGPGVGTVTDWAVPRLTVREASKQTGQLVVVPEQGIRLQVNRRDGLTQLDPKEAGIEQKGVLAFRLLQSDWNLAFDLEQVNPWIQVNSLLDVTVRQGQVQAVCVLEFEIENTGVKSVTVRLPADADGVRFQGDHISDSIQSAEIIAGQRDWEVKLDRRVIGRYLLQVHYQRVSGEQASGAMVTGIEVRNVDLHRGYVAVRTDGRLQLRVPRVPTELQPAEWQTIPSALRRGREAAGARETFRVFEANYRLPVEIIRHDLTKVLPARVRSVDLSSAVSGAGDMVTRVGVTLDPGDKRLLRVRLPEDAVFWFAFVNRQSAWPWREQDDFLIPLEKNSDSEQPTFVEFFYASQTTTGASWSASHQLIGPRLDLPLENVKWSVYVPESWTIRDWKGTLQFQNRLVTGTGGGRADLKLYLDSEAARQRQTLQDAEVLLQKGNEYLAQGAQEQARRAYESAWELSQNDAAFNEDARVQLHNLKMQQAVVGLNYRRGLVADERAGQAAAPSQVKLGDLDGQDPRYTQEQARQILLRNSQEENAVFNRLAERLIDQQNAAVPKPEAIRASLPEQGQVLTFTRSLQVELFSPMEIELEASPAQTQLRMFRLTTLAALFVGFLVITIIARKPRAR